MLEASVKTIREIAKVQVAFSRKSVVFFTPIIWLAPPPNEEDNPPPLGFWIRIINTSNTEQIIIKIEIVSYIGYFFFKSFIKLIWSAKKLLFFGYFKLNFL